jgi:hypothetical protein
MELEIWGRFKSEWCLPHCTPVTVTRIRVWNPFIIACQKKALAIGTAMYFRVILMLYPEFHSRTTIDCIWIPQKKSRVKF